MAARRLIIVLLVLLAISTVAAILAPPIEERSGDSTSTTATEQGPGPDGFLLEERIDATGEPVRIGAQAGDRLTLIVTSPEPTPVQVPALGLSGFADRGAPARFDVFLREAGTIVVERPGGERIATVEVTADPEAPARAEAEAGGDAETGPEAPAPASGG